MINSSSNRKHFFVYQVHRYQVNEQVSEFHLVLCKSDYYLYLKQKILVVSLMNPATVEVTISFLEKKLPGLLFDSVIIIGQMLQVA